ncbi:Uncharacterised protein [uncultured archaeon]|nr:Uncharacterised protein [uncultured archaeon]
MRNTMRQFLPVLFLLSFILIAGCIQKVDINASIQRENISYRVAQIVDTNNCVALVCQEKKSLFGLGSSVNLSGGSCSFNSYNLADKTVLEEFNRLSTRQIGGNASKKYIRMFMLGAGNSIAAADEAQRMCNGRLGLALVDVGILTVPRTLSSGDMSAINCALSNDIIPIIAYGNAPSGYSSSIAVSLSGSGPVIVSPGFGYNGSGQIPNPSQEFSRIKSGCANCMTMATVNLGDNQTLDSYGSGVMAGVDVVGFTIDLGSLKSCGKENVEAAARDFANLIASKWKKPSIIAGIRGVPGPVNGANCEWDSESLSKLYEFMITAIPDLSVSGVIGMIGPDMMSMEDKTLSNGWFYGCAAYHNSTADYQTPAVFSLAGNAAPSLCTNNLNSRLIYLFSGPDNYSSMTLSPVKSLASCGDTCFDAHAYPSSGIFNSDNCTAYALAIRHFSSGSGVDPTLVMSLIDARGGYLDAEQPMRTLYPQCSCDMYSGKTKSICCGVQTLGYFYGAAKKKVTGSSAADEFARSYLAVYGYIAGESAMDSELSNMDDSDYNYSPLVTAVLSKVNSTRNLCGICRPD